LRKTTEDGNISHAQIGNNKVSHNSKVKTGKEIRQSKPPTSLPKILWHSTKWNDEKKKGWKQLSFKK
jgi:hypothetical protein